MVDGIQPDRDGKAAIGGDLVVPALAVGLAVYFFVDIADLAWEAKANALVIASILLVLIAIQLVRMALRVISGEATLAIGGLVEPRALIPTRLAVIAMTGVFIVLLPWLGLTLGLFLLVAAMMTLLFAGSWRKILATAAVVSIAAYLLFILLLNSRMPHGPIEKLLAALF
jgi:Tripartite tricarboxylate transporter TctB family